MKLKVGDAAKWKSQAGGTVREKSGTVLAIVTCGECLRMVLRRLKIDVPRGAVKADADTSMFDRYLVEVPVERKRGGPTTAYYVPKVAVVDAQVHPPPARPVAVAARQESLFASEAGR